MAALESFVNNVQTLSQQGNFSQLAIVVNKDLDYLSKNIALLDNALDTFNVQEHSLGILGILLAKLNGSINDVDSILTSITNFIQSCNGEQIRYATDLFAELSHRLTLILVDKKMPIRGISLLIKAIYKVQLHSSQLTSLHADLCQLCLASKCLKPALPFLDLNVTDINKENVQFDVKYFLLYYYYGGMIYAALKNYKRAAYFFEIAITTPSLAVSHIMLESYKKYILVSLIQYGKVPTLPRYTSHVVARYIKPLCQPYLDLSTVYGSLNQDLNTVVIKHADIFNRDHNMGLVKQCITAIHKKSIQCLTKTFMTLSLTDMANRVHLTSAREAEKYVLNMIEENEIFATINQKDGMVSFHDNPEKYNGLQMLEKINQAVCKSIFLDKQVKEMDNSITINPQYIQKVAGMFDEDGPGGASLKLSHMV